jgi:hypothetical protein
LGEFREKARPAVPALLPLLDDARRDVELSASNALFKIDPEALEKATR